MKNLKTLDIEAVSAAIEADAGHALPDLRESLSEAKLGQFARINTKEEIVARKRGRPVGSTQTFTKEAIKIRLDADVLVALRSTGDGWQTRINDMLRASLALGGKLPLQN